MNTTIHFSPNTRWPQATGGRGFARSQRMATSIEASILPASILDGLSNGQYMKNGVRTGDGWKE